MAAVDGLSRFSMFLMQTWQETNPSNHSHKRNELINSIQASLFRSLHASYFICHIFYKLFITTPLDTDINVRHIGGNYFILAQAVNKGFGEDFLLDKAVGFIINI